MAAQVTVDVRSFIIGTLCGIVILFALGMWHFQQQEETILETTIDSDPVALTAAIPATVDAGNPDYAEQFELQQKVGHVLQTKAQTLLDDIIGKNRSKVRVSVTHLVESRLGSVGRIAKLNVAMAVDKTKLIYDVETNSFREIDRDEEEINRLEQLVKQSVGFDKERGDEVSIFALRFDKSQEIQAKETAVTGERREFWTGVAINLTKIVVILIALLVLRRLWRNSQSTGLPGFLKERDSQAALLIAAGVFLCAHALHLWGDSLSWGEFGALPGLFFLLLGVSRVCRQCASPEAPEMP